MNRLLLLLFGLLGIISSPACTNNSAEATAESNANASSGEYFGGKRVLVAYFSWGGTTRRMAQEIQRVTGADLFEIVPVNPYPTDYTPCTEVALQERDNDARPPIRDRVELWDDYDVVFIGCPVWWHTAPMIISTFAESYDFKGKTVVPFCTYAATYRDETLQKIVDLTPDAQHLAGEGLTSGRINTQTIQAWIDRANQEWNELMGDKDFFTRTTPIADVMADPAFGDFGRLIFPVQTGYWSGNTLEQLQLTYYNYIDPDKTVEIVNNMKSRAMAGETIFFDIYSEEEKQADADKRDTGLFFFKGNPDAPFAICNAGGAFAYVGAMHDSFPHALELSKKGYNAFALIYRPEAAYEDLARAIEYIHDNAGRLGVRADRYSLWGGSAGARMAATLGNGDYLVRLTGRNDLPQASAVIMQYTGYTDANLRDAPTYACVGTNDGIASWRTMQRRLESLSALGIPTEFHAYEGLPHGFGLGTGTVAEGWLNDAAAFWEQQAGVSAISQVKTQQRDVPSIYSIDGIKRKEPQKGVNIINHKKVIL